MNRRSRMNKRAQVGCRVLMLVVAAQVTAMCASRERAAPLEGELRATTAHEPRRAQALERTYAALATSLTEEEGRVAYQTLASELRAALQAAQPRHVHKALVEYGIILRGYLGTPPTSSQPLNSAIYTGAWIAVTLLMGEGFVTPTPPVSKGEVAYGEYVFR